MVRTSLHTCFFCDEYRTVENIAFQLLMCGGSPDEHDDADNSSEEFTEPTRRMVRELADDEGNTHAASPEHMARVSGVLRNREECDRVLRQTRPTDTERKEKQRCMEDLKKALRPEALHWTGSVGKSTALRDAHDLDVCVKLGGGMVGKEALAEIERRLRGSPFVVLRKEASLVLARYGQLELDIIPEASAGQEDKWTAQVEHLHYFEQMSPALKDTVRLVKAWARLRVPVPGVLIETVVDRVGRSEQVGKGSAVQKVFLAALNALSCERAWTDPLNPSNDLRRVLKEREWGELTAYATCTLGLAAVSELECHGCAFMTYPSMHEIQMLFTPDANRSPIDLGMLDGFQIVELCTRLAVRAPAFGSDASFFDSYQKGKRLKGSTKAQSKACSDFTLKFMGADEVKTIFADACGRLERQTIELGRHDSNHEVHTILKELDELYACGEFCRDARPDAFRFIEVQREITLQRIRDHRHREQARREQTNSQSVTRHDANMWGVVAWLFLLLAFFVAISPACFR